MTIDSGFAIPESAAEMFCEAEERPFPNNSRRQKSSVLQQSNRQPAGTDRGATISRARAKDILIGRWARNATNALEINRADLFNLTTQWHEERGQKGQPWGQPEVPVTQKTVR